MTYSFFCLISQFFNFHEAKTCHRDEVSHHRNKPVITINLTTVVDLFLDCQFFLQVVQSESNDAYFLVDVGKTERNDITLIFKPFL